MHNDNIEENEMNTRNKRISTINKDDFIDGCRSCPHCNYNNDHIKIYNFSYLERKKQESSF